MKLLKHFTFLALAIGMITGCKKDQFNDTSLASTAAGASNVSVMFDITHDNSGIVTLTPNSNGATYYDIYFGDAATTSVKVNGGQSTKHTYAEGTYQVKVVAHDLNGGTATITQPLTVSFLAPQNLAVTYSTSNLALKVSATAKYATQFKVYFGDSTTVTPVPFTSMLSNKTITHTYASAGTYSVKVVALSGGAATTEKSFTVSVSKQIDLPVTFEDANTNYTMTDFGGDASSLTVDPANASNHVIKVVKTAGAQTWAGTTIGTSLGFANKIPLTNALTRMSVAVYSPAAGLDVKLKLDNHTNANNGLSVETDVKTTVANQWEILTFDFSKPAANTPAFKATNTYDLASIFFDFGNAGTGSVFYFDNLQLAPASKTQIALPVSFEDPTVDYTVTDFGGNSSVLKADPANAANHVIASTKTAGAQTWAGTTIGTPNGFLHAIPVSATAPIFTVRVYSPAAGLDIKLKLDNHANPNNGLSVETDVKTTVANQWETLTFDFSKNAANTPAFKSGNTYDLASIFFDFGNAGTGSVFYWDDVTLLQ